MNERKLWFRAKYYGWGWYPISWQGWAVLGIYVAALALDIILTLPHNKQQPTFLQLALFTLTALSLTMFLLGVCYTKGEPPKWQWGKPKSDKNE